MVMISTSFYWRDRFPSLHICHRFIFMTIYIRKRLWWWRVCFGSQFWSPRAAPLLWGHGQVAHHHGNTWKEILTNWTASRKRGRGGLGFYSLHLGCVTHGKKTSLKVSSPPQLYHLSPKHLMCGLFRDIYTDNSEISRQVEINCKACFLF